MTKLAKESAFEVLARARELEARGRNVVHLEIGQPDFDSPNNIKYAAMKALVEGKTSYTPSAGIPELRTATAEYVARTRGIAVNPRQVVVVPGGKPTIFYTIMALCEAGDEVIYPNPGFPTYESVIAFSGAQPVPARLLMEKNFSFDLEEFRGLVTERTKLIILNSPHNPTGGIIPPHDLAEVAKIAVENDIMVLSDEIYSRLQYDGEFTSIASFPNMTEHTVILDGFSKTYAMTGWRLGYGVMPEWLAGHVTKLMTNSNSCNVAFTQYGGIEALTGPQDEVEEMRAAFLKRREVIIKGLNEIPGFKCLMPAGAFYAFPHIAATGKTAQEMADYLLDEAGVATLAGTSFGEYGEGFIRLSYANSIENIERALERIDAAVRKI